MPTIAQKIADIKQQISSTITLLAVVKNVSTEKIFEALDAGIDTIGENRIQEASERIQAIRQKYPNIKIHFIGHLQSNKINQALQMFDVIESVDSFELAEAINKRAEKPVEIFVEVNTSGEQSKNGVDLKDAIDLIDKISTFKNLRLTGLMTIGANSSDEEKVRACFRKLREIRDESSKKGYTNIVHLSMGMSHDFPIAIEEGSDIIRIGTGIFGNRR
ncbi:YggS family pyridoxal phosphate-dependent enzyme [Candidatus Saganbacteria bacterium]|nr:YggS family pyridoxal phosphate-dependent enzyme [Candidatus Saganbacteria bacterium]